jgi:hypothetical protein
MPLGTGEELGYDIGRALIFILLIGIPAFFIWLSLSKRKRQAK